jgi:hypothetical protein
MIIARADFSISTAGNRRPHFGFGRRLSGLFRRWICCQRPFLAVAGDSVSGIEF